MAHLSFKLGDKIVVSTGLYAGYEGYIVLIAGEQDAYLITVRLSVGPDQKDLVVKPTEIRRVD